MINYQDEATVPGWVLTHVDNQNNYKLQTKQQSTNWVNFNFPPLPLSHKTFESGGKMSWEGDKVAAGEHHFNIINLLRLSALDTKIGQIPREEEFL